MKVHTTNPSPGPLVSSLQKPSDSQNSEPTPPQDSFQSGSESPLGQWLPVLGAAAVGAGLGAFAGLGTGVLPAFAGVAAGTGFGVVGMAGAARLGFDEASATAGAVGLVGGAIASGYLGFACSSPVAAVALGAVGGLGFGFFKAISGFMAN